MKAKIEYKSFFIYSESKNKCFFTTFKPGVNIIYGKNTSGKSTIIQAIHYTFGINDEKHKLAEILNENVIFRLDFILSKSNQSEMISLVRDTDFIYVKRFNQPTIKFFGISGNSSKEHIHLKEFFGKLFGFNLQLESSGEYKLGSLESMFLPYYVSQDYGWVLTLKSFRGLDFFKNFKIDYYDYYLGIINEYDRVEKQILDSEKKAIENEIKFLNETEQTNVDFKLSKLKDEAFVLKSVDYIEEYKKNKEKLIVLEKEYILLCNKSTFFEERLKILKKIKTSLKKQKPAENDCPTCLQSLPNTIEKIYEYYQDFNNTDEEINRISLSLKGLQGKINSIEENISLLKEKVSNDYSILLQYKIDDLTYNSWIENKTNIQLSKNIVTQIGELNKKLGETSEKLKVFKTDEELITERNNKDYIFKKYFEFNLGELKVKKFDEPIYTLLYKMKLFPKQGVELLKTLLAYNFAFNKIIKDTSHVHRFPFMMDAIFKEDIDEGNRGLILKFINNEKPKDTQVIFSIAESKENKKTAIEYNNEYFDGKAKLILTNSSLERSLLSEFKNDYYPYLEETISIME